MVVLCEAGDIELTQKVWQDMAKNSTTFKKGDNRRRKPKGAVNRTTKEAKEFLEYVLYGELENMKKALQTLFAKDPARYLEACSKLFVYVLPKKTDMKIDSPIQQNINVIVDTSETAKTLKELRNGGGG